MYELGYFSRGKSKNRYLGIWYKLISSGTVVWVANRDMPLTNTSGVFKVSSDGILLLLNEGDPVIWSSNSSVSLRKMNLAAQLLDNGNLVVRNESCNDQGNFVWQSFDYPGDTLLPGMKLGKDLVTGIDRQLTSWKSPDDPSPVVQRTHLKWDGITGQLNWIERTQEWIVYGTEEVDFCGHYAICGSYGSFSINKYPPYSYMEGFEPRRPEEWNTADWSGGCQHKIPLDCGDGYGFQKVSGVKFPDTRRSSYNQNMTLGECEMACKRKCNCTTYSSLDIRNGGSGCLLWFNDLMDVREYAENQDLYIRRAASELAGHTFLQSGSNKKKTIYAVVLSIPSVPLLLLGLAVAVNVRKKKRRRSYMKGHALDKNHTSVQKEDLDQLPFFTLYEIEKATNYLSIDNKIGEGGFGPVYEGVLEEGQKVAVKRLSKTSQQGLDEFKNEVMCIAKLQHRILVKLLGYCTHGDEMILIYECMANKSLDSFLFGLAFAVIAFLVTFKHESTAKTHEVVNFLQMKPEVQCLIGLSASALFKGLLEWLHFS